MANYTIDINADLGEGCGLDQGLMPLISSCSIACGGHYGTRESILATLALAKKHGVKVGAHPGYPDQANFGRVIMDIDLNRLEVSLRAQLEEFRSCCHDMDMQVNHIKPHGALYNHSAKNLETARVLAKVYHELNFNCPMYALPSSILASNNNFSIPIKKEAFIDRTYTNTGKLVSRSVSGALITQGEAAWEQLEQLVTQQRVTTLEGETIAMQASTYCIHGDSLESLSILTYIHQQISLNKDFIVS